MTLNQILESIRSVSKILGAEKKGELLVSDIQETLKKIQAQSDAEIAKIEKHLKNNYSRNRLSSWDSDIIK